ncbi:hypothetical protein [Pigmentiphaga sp.]|uniref:hypothetical protein n=1 Tax=Pigmentiphaga sp. TaxID=1977564 RepID=UPI0025DB8EC5|nr:hypothetical protein [Pigmentiphaga sp.]
MNSLQVAVVRGSNDIGSAVAHAMFSAGMVVVLHDTEMPAHGRRAMAFTDAFYAGSAFLDGVPAHHFTDIESICRSAGNVQVVMTTALPLLRLITALRSGIVVDARMRKRSIPDDERHLAPLLIGIGPGFNAGRNCSVAIESAWGQDLGKVIWEGPTATLAGEPQALNGAGRERYVYAPASGTWRTPCQVGQTVKPGQIVGYLGTTAVSAPIGGTLRGLAHDNAIATERQKVVEVDPSPQASISGLGARPSVIARGVLNAATTRR